MLHAILEFLFFGGEVRRTPEPSITYRFNVVLEEHVLEILGALVSSDVELPLRK